MSTAHVPPAHHAHPLATLPAGPPPEVEAAVSAALRRAEALAAQGRELHFDVGAGGDLRVQVRDLTGGVLRHVATAEALGILSGLDGA